MHLRTTYVRTKVRVCINMWSCMHARVRICTYCSGTIHPVQPCVSVFMAQVTWVSFQLKYKPFQENKMPAPQAFATNVGRVKTHAGKSWKVAPICPNYLTLFLANTDVIWCDIGESIQSRFAMFAFSPFSPGFGRTNMQRSQGMVLAHRQIWCSQTLWAATTTAAYIKSRVWLMTRGW